MRDFRILGVIWVVIVGLLGCSDTSSSEVESDVCRDYVCQNGGTCSAESGSARCTCLNGYTGDHCEIEDEVTGKPTAVIELSKASVYLAEELTVSAANSTDDGTIVSYAWDFGNGVRLEGPTHRYLYFESGSYEIQLIVTDDSGLSSVAKKRIDVRFDGKDYFVSPDGQATASGTIDDPLDVYTLAEEDTTPVKAGDRVYIREGVYTAANLEFELKGTAQRPITVQPYQHERVIFMGGAVMNPLFDT